MGMGWHGVCFISYSVQYFTVGVLWPDCLWLLTPPKVRFRFRFRFSQAKEKAPSVRDRVG